MNPRKEPTIPPSRRRDVDEAAEKFTQETAAAPPAAPEVKLKRLSLEVPELVHRRFKSAAADRGTSMIGAVLSFMRAYSGMAPWPADVVDQVKAQIAADADAAGTSPDDAPRARTSRRTA